ncbi:ankyrin repeat-containing domain protein [Mariannaea sp. PMI_226]|nr:ankyrin repeat-containing domain protein [Mariannaea sp. PMI_226]
MIRSFALLWRIFLRIVRDPKVGSLYVILDALDKCEEASCHQLLESISEILADSSQPMQSGSRIKFLITSRPFLHQLYANTRKALQSQISIDDDQTGYTDDLRVFIQERFSSHIRDFLYQTITSKANRTFLLLTSKKDFQKIIANIPEGLLLLACSRPLHLDELNIAFTIDASHVTADDIMQDTQNSIAHTVQGILGSLVRITGQHVSLVYLSVKGFLLEQVAPNFDSFPTIYMANIQVSALQLATACIQYLLLDDFKVDLFPTDATGPALEIPDFIDELPLGGYSGNFWDEEAHNLTSDEHFAMCEEVASDDLRIAARSLLDVKMASCRNWLRFYRTQARTSLCLAFLDQDPILLASNSTYARSWMICYVSRFGHDRTAPSLLKVGAEPNSTVAEGQTALTTASEHGNLTCVIKLLADERTDTNMLGRDGRNALSFACSGGHDNIVNGLLRWNTINADKPNNSEATPFFWAVGGGHHSIISNLARLYNVNINHQDRIGRTAIPWASGDKMADTLVRLLKIPSIYVNIKDKKGISPLLWAAGNGCVDKASIDNNKRSAILWAGGNGHCDALVKLFNEGCPGVDIEDIDGWTPLTRAIQTDPLNVQIERRDGDALQAGANPEIKDNRGSTPISIAKQFGRDDLLEEFTVYRA